MAYHPFRNLGLKFLSTLVAVMVWLIVAGERVDVHYRGNQDSFRYIAQRVRRVVDP